MSYLAQPTSKTEYGVVQVGNYINVVDGVISLEQDLGPNANVTFYNANVTHQLTATNANITTQLVASNASIDVLTSNTANITSLLSSNANITTLAVSTGNVTTLNSLNANVSGNLYANGNLVVTDVTPSAGPGINLSNVVTTGYHPHFTVTNTGVLSLANGAGISTSSSNGNITVTNTGVLNLTAGTGISLSGSTGNVTVAVTGTSYINVIGVTANYTPTTTDEYIGVYSGTAVTITLPNAPQGRVYIIKDEYGQGSGKITLQPQANVLIDGKANYIISVPNQAINIVQRAGNWWII